MTASTTKAMRNRQRVSSHDLYQSMSVLRVDRGGDRLEKNLFERQRQHVHRYGIERARFSGNRIRAGAREHAQHATVPPRANDAWRAERNCRRVLVEDDLYATIAIADVIERSADDGVPAIDNRHVVGDLIDVGQL